MADKLTKLQIYESFKTSGIFIAKDFVADGEAPYTVNINNILSDNKLFDNYSLLIENTVKNYTTVNNIAFDKICAARPSSIPYATNISTSFQKGLLYVNDSGNIKTEKGNIKNIKIEGGMQIDDKILIIETIASPDYLLNNIITKITKFGGNIVGIIIMFNKMEGEFANLIMDSMDSMDSMDKCPIITIINLYDFCTTLENNNMIEMFYTEKIKFYCEKKTKENIKYFTS
jgi:orotate phosphoribosyltransferase